MSKPARPTLPRVAVRTGGRAPFKLGGRAAEQRKIGAIVQATNVIASIPLTLDFKDRAEEKFGRKLFDCEANGVRRSREAFVPKSLMRGFAKPRREQLRPGAVIEPHGASSLAPSGERSPERALFERHTYLGIEFE